MSLQNNSDSVPFAGGGSTKSLTRAFVLDTIVVMKCPCGLDKDYAACCEPYLEGDALAPTPEALMRSRYTAFALKKTDYLQETTDPQTQMQFDFAANEQWAREATFTQLEILSSSMDGNKGQVEFKAHFTVNGENHVHHEKSRFRKQKGHWFFREGKVQPSAPVK